MGSFQGGGNTAGYMVRRSLSQVCPHSQHLTTISLRPSVTGEKTSGGEAQFVIPVGVLSLLLSRGQTLSHVEQRMLENKLEIPPITVYKVQYS